MKVFGYELEWEQFEDRLNWVRLYQRHAVIAAMVTAIVIYVWGVGMPEFRHYQEQKARLAQLETILEQKQRSQSGKQSLEKRLFELRTQLQTSQAKIFSEEEFSLFLFTDFPFIAQSLGVKIGAIGFLPVQPLTTHLDIRPISFESEGPYLGVSQLISQLESSPKLLTISEASIERKSDMPVVLKCRLVINAYVQQQLVQIKTP